MSKQRRPGRVFIDWSQNDAHKTTVAVYSLRAMAMPAVSTPVTWEEAESGRSLGPFMPDEVIKRIRRHDDLFAPVLTLRQRLPMQS
jgi:bifunctional non-homologous end joining protein LigD